MRVAEPSYLLLLWLIPILAAFYVYSFRKRERLLQQFARSEMLSRLLPPVSRTRQRAKAALLSTALVFGILALLRPQWGFHWEEMKRKGVDIMVAVDVSQSMMAEDVSPNRLERAKHELEDLLDLLEGDRIGLIAFAGTGFVQCPLTLDYGAFSMFLDYLSPDLIPVPGTSITDAIRLAQQSFVEQSSASKALIVITDGEDHEGSPLEAAKEAKEAGIEIYTIGIGGDQGAPIPSPDGDGFIKDEKGQLAMTRLDEETLQKIAVETGGAYVRSTSGSLDLDKIYTEGIKESLNATELKSTRQKKWEERFQWPLLVTVLIVLLDPFVSERRRRRRAPVSAALCLLLLGGMPTAEAGILGDTTIQEGLDAYEQGDYETALQKLTDAGIEHPNDPLLDYNMGNAYYKTREFDKAEASYTKAIVRSTEAGIREKAYYNLGNTAFQQGKLDKAVEHYQEALKIDPSDMDAKRNLELTQKEIQRRLDAAKQQQEKQKQQQQQQQSSGDQDKGGQGEQKQTQPEQQGEQPQNAGEGQQPTPAPGGQGQGEPTPSLDEQNPAAQQAQAGQDKKDQDQENAQQQAASAGDNKEEGQEGEEQPVKMGQLSKEEAERLLNQVKDQQQAGLKARQQGGRGHRAPGGKPW